MTPNETTCSACGREGTRVRKISLPLGRGAKEILVRNVPSISCPHCGESFFTAKTLHELDRIKRDPDKLAEELKIVVVEFPDAGERRTG